jgi:hypothetical protein
MTIFSQFRFDQWNIESDTLTDYSCYINFWPSQQRLLIKVIQHRTCVILVIMGAYIV